MDYWGGGGGGGGGLFHIEIEGKYGCIIGAGGGGEGRRTFKSN